MQLTSILPYVPADSVNVCVSLCVSHVDANDGAACWV